MSATPTRPRPLLVTDEPALVDQVLQVAASLDLSLDVAVDLAAARGRWSSASLVLIGHDVRPATRRLPSRSDVVLVSLDLDDAQVWSRAALMGCESVRFLPDDLAWLDSRLRRAAGAGDVPGPVIAVLGGRGGGGASVVAATLAYTAARTGWFAALVDADPLGGGLDLMFSADGADLEGSWRGNEALSGRLDLLVRQRGAGPPQDLADALTRMAPGQDLVVVDLPRGDRDRCAAGLRVATTALVVVPAEVRAVVSAAALCRWATGHCSDVRVVVRCPTSGGLPAEVVTDSIGLPVSGILESEKGLRTLLDRGAPPGTDRGPLRVWAEQFLRELGVPAARISA